MLNNIKKIYAEGDKENLIICFVVETKTYNN